MSSMTSASPHSVVLALNSGSSSLKFGLYRIEPSIPKVLLSGEVESTGSRQGKFWAKDGNGTVLVSELTNFETSRDAVARIGRFLADRSETQLFAVGHRVVHGGPTLRRHCVIDGAVLGKTRRGRRLRTAAQSSGVVRHSIRAGELSAIAAGCLLRHCVSCAAS
jgi:acetate kinase